MWFKLNTTFTQSLGTLESLSNSWSITRNLTNFSTTSTTTSVTKNSSYSATFTLNSGCTYSSHSVTMGGAAVTSGVSYSNGTLTVNISKVTGAVVITAVATGASSGGGDEEKTLQVVYESGPNQTTGYYHNSAGINGYLIPMDLNSIPEKIDAVRVYLRGMNDGDVKNVRVDIGYVTNSESNNNIKTVKTASKSVTLGTNFTTPYDFEIECTKSELETAMSSTTALYWFVAVRPADGVADASYCMGISNAYASSNNFTATANYKGFYFNNNAWKANSAKQYLYAGVLALS